MEITRADLAASYLAFEAELRAHPPGAERIADLNRKFDGASIAFFTGRFGSAVEAIDALTFSLTPSSGASDARRVAASLKVRIEPAVQLLASAEAPTLQIGSMYLVELREREALTLKLVIGRDGKNVASRELRITTRGVSGLDVLEDLQLDRNGISPGAYRIELLDAAGAAVRTLGRWYVVERSLDAIRPDNERRIQMARATNASIDSAAAICQARNKLLSDAPSEQQSAQFLTNLLALREEVADEISAIEAGRNPYLHRRGEYWRPLIARDKVVPMWVFAPDATEATDAAPAPLVIALHGAGGDERMFMDGYGAGIIRELAAQKSFLLATPETYPMLTDPDLLEPLIDSLAQDYSVDRDRIYVLGHSLGAGAASILSGRKPELIAAVYCISGGRGWDGYEQIPPTIVASGTLDPIVPHDGLAAEVERAKAAGLPVEFRSRESYGHTLLVGVELPVAIEWLLGQKRVGRPATSRPKP